MDYQVKSPVIFLIFNRPDTTRRVFEEIRKVKPPVLLVAADGPRNESEREICERTRRIVDAGVDWKCEILKNYSDVNLGCKDRVSSGITWAFENVDRAIILEDDCLPHPTFFRFCDELLEKYKDDESIMHISGDNFQSKNNKFHCEDGYYFSNISHIWGWATWRRAWKHYDVNMISWPQVKENGLLLKTFEDEAEADRWEDKFDQYYAKKINSWDGQWSYACLVNRGLCVMPKVNLISNIGFGKEATHTNMNITENELANLPIYPMSFPLIHPEKREVNKIAADYISNYIFGVYKYHSLRHKIRRAFKKAFPTLYERVKDKR